MNDGRWLELGERRGNDYAGCLLAVAGACLAEDAEENDVKAVLTMLADV